jgi:phage tail-like protein
MADKLVPISYIKLDLGGPQGDGLFMSASLPGGTITQEARKVYDMQGGNTNIQTPSHVEWSDIQLTRGLDKKKSCYDWFIKIAEEGPEGNTKNIKLELLDQKKQTVMAWSMEEAFISGYRPSASAAGGAGVAVEDLTIHYSTAKRTV